MRSALMSQLATGTVVIVGSTVVAFAPAPPVSAVRVPDLPVAASLQVALAAEATPTAVFDPVMAQIQAMIDGLPSFEELVAALTPAVVRLIPALLPPSLISDLLGGITSGASALLFGAVGDVLGYIGSAIGGLIFGARSLPRVFLGAVAEIPGEIVATGQAIVRGNAVLAWDTLTAGLTAPGARVDARLVETNESIQAYAGATFMEALNGLPEVIFGALADAITNNTANLTEALVQFVNDLFPDLQLPTAPAASTLAAAAVSAVGTPRAEAPRDVVAPPAAAVSADPVAATTITDQALTADAPDVAQAPASPRSRAALTRPSSAEVAEADAAADETAPRRGAGRHAEKPSRAEASSPRVR